MRLIDVQADQSYPWTHTVEDPFSLSDASRVFIYSIYRLMLSVSMLFIHWSAGEAMYLDMANRFS